MHKKNEKSDLGRMNHNSVLQLSNFGNTDDWLEISVLDYAQSGLPYV